MDVRLGGRLVGLDGLGVALSRGGNAAVALLLAFSLACGGDRNELRTPTGPTPTSNRAPVASGSIPAQSVPRDESVHLELAQYFSDPDGDP